MEVVLIEPEIPQNTGNIARTCVATGTKLHLVKPLGFSIKDRQVKRAGLDYWDDLDLEIHESIDEFLSKTKNRICFYISTKAPNSYDTVSFPDDALLIFGKETKGLPEDLLVNNISRCIRIPMIEKIRSLNLSNAVAIVVYEALRQNSFQNLSGKSDYLTTLFIDK